MVKTTTNYPEMCECGRLYKDRRDKEGKTLFFNSANSLSNISFLPCL
jgi:hypothetical protein